MKTSSQASSAHTLPDLPYHHEALEPCIDVQTMLLHHEKHHASYVSNLNEALEPFPELQARSALWLLLNLGAVPAEIRATVHNNAGGHVNHSLFWNAMSPAGPREPQGLLANAIAREFGDMASFKRLFREAGESQFGSGWVWLTKDPEGDGRLGICTTDGHDNPLRQGLEPILVNDVWEHAYYLKHQNRRGEYLDHWWRVANWSEAERRFDHDGPVDEA